MKIFISGPITKGDLTSNFYTANDLYFALMNKGHAVYNPYQVCFCDIIWVEDNRTLSELTRNPGDRTNEEWTKMFFPWIEVSDVLVRIPGESVGGDLEVAYAKSLNIPVIIYEGLNKTIKAIEELNNE